MTSVARPARHGDDVPAPHQREPGWLLLAYAVGGGPLIWMAHLAASAALVHVACVHGLTWVINVVTAASAVPTVGAIAAAWFIRRSLVSPVGAYTGRTRALGFLGLLFGVVSLLLILLEGAPVWFLDACRVG